MAAAIFLPTAEGAAAGRGTVMFETDSGPHSYTVELATTDSERALGLMFRRTLPEKSGMLFLYDPPQAVAMWMKNTYLPLDMVFISKGGTVRRIEADTEPFSTDIIPSGGPVVGVLELNAGEAEKIGLKPGDRVIYPGLGAAP